VITEGVFVLLHEPSVSQDGAGSTLADLIGFLRTNELRGASHSTHTKTKTGVYCSINRWRSAELIGGRGR
jgi:hypothetical protein